MENYENNVENEDRGKKRFFKEKVLPILIGASILVATVLGINHVKNVMEEVYYDDSNNIEGPSIVIDMDEFN